jgi:hypothetical protein
MFASSVYIPLLVTDTSVRGLPKVKNIIKWNVYRPRAVLEKAIPRVEAG